MFADFFVNKEKTMVRITGGGRPNGTLADFTEHLKSGDEFHGLPFAEFVSREKGSIKLDAETDTVVFVEAPEPRPVRRPSRGRRLAVGS